jgi:hypothetical protein
MLRPRTAPGAAWLALPILTATALLLTVPSPGDGQALPVEIGVFHLAGSSDLAELERPRGLAVALRIRARPWLTIRSSIFAKGDDSARRGRVCTIYAPPSNCRDENVQAETTLVGAEVTAHVVRRLHPSFEIDAGAGASMSRITVDEVTESGRTSSLLGQNSGQPGLTLSTSGRFRPVDRLPLVLEVGLAQHFVRLNACSENQALYTPFCRTSSLRELRVGVAFAPAW